MLKYLSPDLHPLELTANSAGHVITQIVVAETVVSHSGKYKCEPGGAPGDEVLVHVLDGEFMKFYFHKKI